MDKGSYEILVCFLLLFGVFFSQENKHLVLATIIITCQLLRLFTELHVVVSTAEHIFTYP